MPSISYIMHKNINHGNHHVVATFRTQEQTNEHLGKLLYSILSPTRLLREETKKKTSLLELTYGTKLQEFISPHFFHATQLFANYNMAHHSGTYFFNYSFTFPNIATCSTSNTVLTYIIYVHTHINFITGSQPTTHTCYVHYITPQNHTPDNNFF